LCVSICMRIPRCKQNRRDLLTAPDRFLSNRELIPKCTHCGSNVSRTGAS
jgi:hypothetical protein